MTTMTTHAAPANAQSVLGALKWRYAVKKFDAARKLTPEQLAALEESAILAPSSFGLSPWKIIVIEDKALREKLKAVSWNQPQVVDASHLFVFCRRKGMDKAEIARYIDRIAEVRKVDRASLAGYENMMGGYVDNAKPEQLDVWTSRQTYIALGFVLQTAALLGIDTCPMEGFDAGQYDQLLGLKDTLYSSTVILPVGYRAADDSYAALPKVRFDKKDVITRR